MSSSFASELEAVRSLAVEVAGFLGFQVVDESPAASGDALPSPA